MKQKTLEAEVALQEVLENPPAWWTDPDGGRGPSAGRLSWRVYCMAGAGGLAQEIAVLKHYLTEHRRGLARAEHLMDEANVANYGAAVRGGEKQIEAKERLLAAVGGWANAGMSALTTNMANAQAALEAATQEALRYEGVRLHVPARVRGLCDKEMAAPVKAAQAAFDKAEAARAELLERVEADRQALDKLRRRVA